MRDSAASAQNTRESLAPRRRRLGGRGAVLLVIALGGLISAASLGLGPAGLRPHPGGFEIAREFFGAALRPAIVYERPPIFADAPPFALKLGAAVLRTLAFALAAMSLALPLGALLGFVASDAFWRPESFGGGRLRVWARPLQICVRVLIALMRSIHELLWAVIFLAALGLNSFAAVVALTIPFAGTLAKVFSEMLDEADPRAARAFHGLGAPPAVVMLIGLGARALPDVLAYSFYRLECAVRSSAVLGFFGYLTVGYHLSLAFGDLRYREVWAYIYALVAVVVALEAWSGAIRRRLVA